MEKIPLVICVEDNLREEEGEQLSRDLKIPLVRDPSNYPLILALTASKLELRLPFEKIKPLYVDFLSEEIRYRLAQSRVRNELIARSVGIKGGYYPTVIDTTAGLGQDALILTHLGCEVIMIERSPIIHALLKDALTRARKESPAWLPRLTLYGMDARLFLEKKIAHQEQVDVVYLDPMFPVRTKSALVKKEMRILKLLVGADEDSIELFELAKKVAKKRLVVKRPLHAGTLTQEPPVIQYKGKACRFDVYI